MAKRNARTLALRDKTHMRGSSEMLSAVNKPRLKRKRLESQLQDLRANEVRLEREIAKAQAKGRVNQAKAKAVKLEALRRKGAAIFDYLNHKGRIVSSRSREVSLS